MPSSEQVVVTPAVLRDWRLPEPGEGKGARGKLVVVGGTVTTPGAVLLAGEAALRVGAGKVSLATPAPVAAALGVAVPEARVLGLPATPDGSIAGGASDELAGLVDGADAVLLGSGFTDPGSSASLLRGLVDRVRSPLALDALASAYLSDEPQGLHHLDGRAVLTVNPSELAHTAGCDQEEVDKDPLAVAATVARRSRVVVVCGAADKHIAGPDGGTWLVHGGGPGLGLSGSGDVQAGVVGGLLARGAGPEQAAVWGAYLHARTGERLAAEVGAVGYLARELPRQVPLVLAELA